MFLDGVTTISKLFQKQADFVPTTFYLDVVFLYETEIETEKCFLLVACFSTCGKRFIVWFNHFLLYCSRVTLDIS